MNGDAGVKGVNVIFINGFVVVVVVVVVDVTGVADVFDIPCDGVNL
jgi:hypothetical protein